MDDRSFFDSINLDPMRYCMLGCLDFGHTPATLPFPAIPPGSQNNKNTKETTMVKTKKPAAKKTPAKAAAPKKAAPAKAPAVKKSAAKKPCKKCCKGK